ncbi:MAG: DUF1786 domain-containing protein [Chloroflexia bacterium]
MAIRWPLLALDIGSGTQDLLLYDPAQPLENCVKMILPSPTVLLARRIAWATAAGRDIFLHGLRMGGGPCVSALKRHLRAGYRVYATPEAARTVRDNPAEVQALGIQIVSAPPDDALPLETGDIQARALQSALSAFDLEWPPSFAVAVQDHGESAGEGQRRFRFRQWEAFLAGGGDLSALLYEQPPPHLTRMEAVRQVLPEAFLMDTGAAAVWGALSDEAAAAHREEGLVVVNVGNQHTLGVLVQGRRIWGLFEHHTAVLDTAGLARWVEELRAGTISGEAVYAENGHGACVDPHYPGETGRFRFVVVTGPRRELARPLGYHRAAPYGDMMLVGALGLVSAVRARAGLGELLPG